MSMTNGLVKNRHWMMACPPSRIRAWAHRSDSAEVAGERDGNDAARYEPKFSIRGVASVRRCAGSMSRSWKLLILGTQEHDTSGTEAAQIYIKTKKVSVSRR